MHGDTGLIQHGDIDIIEALDFGVSRLDQLSENRAGVRQFASHSFGLCESDAQNGRHNALTFLARIHE